MKLAEYITKAVDFFYVKPIRKIVPLQTFRYAVCGGANMLLGILLYSLIFRFVVRGYWLDLGFVTMSPATLSLFIQYPITFLIGFWLNRNVTFTLSPLKGKVQFIRYILQSAGSFLVEYLFLKLFSEALHIYPTIAKPLADIVTVVYSYCMAKFFTFRGGKAQ